MRSHGTTTGLYHDRLVLAACACQRGWHVVLTPDFDLYEEQVSLENQDIASFHIAPPEPGSLPFGLTELNTYRFRAQPGPERMAQMLVDARHAAAAFGLPPGAGAGAMAAPLAAPAQVVLPQAADAGFKWVRVETGGGVGRGAVVELDGSEVIRGEVGLKQMGGDWVCIRRVKDEDIPCYCGAEAASDARLLGIKFQDLKREERTWRDVANELVEEPFADWNVPGPRTSAWCIRFLNRRSGGPMDHHKWWMHTHSLRSDSWGAAELENCRQIGSVRRSLIWPMLLVPRWPFACCSSLSTTIVIVGLVVAKVRQKGIQGWQEG